MTILSDEYNRMLPDIASTVLNMNALLVGLATGLFIYWVIKKLKYKLPPGPFALPLIGNIHLFKDSLIHEQFYKWSLKYGPVISVYLGPTYSIVVNDIDTAMEVLVKKGGDFANRVSIPSVQVFTDGEKDIAFGQYGPTWKLHRKIASKALRYYMMGEALEERTHDAVSVAIEGLRKQKGPFDPKHHVNFIAGNILTGLCFAGKYKFDDPVLSKLEKLDDDLKVLLDGIGILENIIPGLQYVWETQKMKEMKSISKELVHDFIGGKFREHQKSFDRSNIRDFTDTLILARQEAEEDPTETYVDKLSDTHLIQTISDIFFAGLDTTRLTLRFALLHMATYPEIQAKVQEEIDRVVGFDDMPRLSHREDLGYTEAVLHESMRVATVVPTGIVHKTVRDTSVGGYTIPKDTNVIINHWALHHDPRKWDKVTEFIPERYLDKDGKLGPKPENWLPFSAGRRVCLGEMVAKPELHLIFASLMQRFSWSFPKGKKADITPTGNMFILIPKPCEMIMKERTPK